MSVNDGGSIFGREHITSGLGVPIQQGHSGLSLRDYFAGQALMGMIATDGARLDGMSIHCYVASVAYIYADAMLAERSKTP
jgi:hypothetical protein